MSLAANIIPTLILLAGVVNDIRERKVRNILVVTSALAAIVSTLVFRGINESGSAMLAFGAALAMTLPLVLAKVLGAGDMKLLMAFALAVTPQAVFSTFVISIFTGALLGVFRAALSGHFVRVLKNTGSILRGTKPDQLNTTKIPYTVALLFGWLTYLSLEWHGGRL